MLSFQNNFMYKYLNFTFDYFFQANCSHSTFTPSFDRKTHNKNPRCNWPYNQCVLYDCGAVVPSTFWCKTQSLQIQLAHPPIVCVCLCVCLRNRLLQFMSSQRWSRNSKKKKGVTVFPYIYIAHWIYRHNRDSMSTI